MTDVYSTPGTFVWTCPVGVTVVEVICIGAGADGGSPGGGQGGRGGGGGAWSKTNAQAVTPGLDYDVFVPNSASGVGASFARLGTPFCRGDSAALEIGGLAASGVGDTLWSGGDGASAGAAGSDGSGGGESGHSAGDGNDASGQAGGTGTAGSNGGNGGTSPDGNGVNGVSYGGGGGGGADATGTPGTGAGGYVSLTYTAAAASGPSTLRRRGTRFFRQGF